MLWQFGPIIKIFSFSLTTVAHVAQADLCDKTSV